MNDPYFSDEWYGDEGDGYYYTGTCEECFGTGYDSRGAACEYCGGSGYDMSGDSPTLPLPPFMEDKRNPILRIVSAVVLFVRRVFRLPDPEDRIPY
jgi:hypothetical protein